MIRKLLGLINTVAEYGDALQPINPCNHLGSRLYSFGTWLCIVTHIPNSCLTAVQMDPGSTADLLTSILTLKPRLISS